MLLVVMDLLSLRFALINLTSGIAVGYDLKGSFSPLQVLSWRIVIDVILELSSSFFTSWNDKSYKLRCKYNVQYTVMSNHIISIQSNAYHIQIAAYTTYNLSHILLAKLSVPTPPLFYTMKAVLIVNADEHGE